MRKNVEQAMDALFAGKSKRTAHSVVTEQDGEYVVVDPERFDPMKSTWSQEQAGILRAVPTIYSYGRHFPMALLIDQSTVLVHTGKASVTTSCQQSSVREYLRYEGFRPVEEAVLLNSRSEARVFLYQKWSRA